MRNSLLSFKRHWNAKPRIQPNELLRTPTAALLASAVADELSKTERGTFVFIGCRAIKAHYVLA